MSLPRTTETTGANSSSSSNSRNFIHEMESIICDLERGTVVTKYFFRKKPEKKVLSILRETRQVVWKRNQSDKNIIEGAVDLREIKEIRQGKTSKDFEKWPDESKRQEATKCFIVFYGVEFRLRTLSISAMSEKECDLWVKGLNFLLKDTVNLHYPGQLDIWLRKEFYSMCGNFERCHDGAISLKDMKVFLPKINCKMSTGKLRDSFQAVDTRKSGSIGFDDFSLLFHQILHDQTIFTNFLGTYSLDGERVTLKEFQTFLTSEQKECKSPEQVSEFLRNFLKDPDRDIHEPYLTKLEFVDFLFSKQNEIFEPKEYGMTQDMTRPLSHYWIASSHNTYLTGDQFSSESSVEAYARCLLQGCRCVELDCWDGPDGLPFIFHGHTLTTKIKFVDVLKCIKEHAFVASQYPVVLSIEDHCSLVQQRKIAQKFQEIFGDMLVTQYLDRNETCLPSPEALKRRIILKHKKLPEGADEGSFIPRTDDFCKDMDLSNTIKNGIAYIEDAENLWRPHFFVLTHNKLVYTEMMSQNLMDEDEENLDETIDKVAERQEELHFSEKWFHGRLKGGRNTANELLEKYRNFGDGTFLVRESETFVGDYTLSFWRRGRVNHCHIHSKYEWGQVKYYLIDSLTFDSLYSLITYYRSNPIRGLEFQITLTEPIPQPQSHETQPWFHSSIDRVRAEDKLKRVQHEGAFLVRIVQHGGDERFAISFRAENRIKHCVIKEDGRLFVVGLNKFENLVDLVQFYEKNLFYNQIMLKVPVTDELVKKFGLNPNDGDDDVYGHPDYLDTNAFNHQPLSVRTLYDYEARRADELSFAANEIITNVVQEHRDWWIGDLGLKKQRWFPVNYVEVVATPDPPSSSSSDSRLLVALDPPPDPLLGTLQKGSIEMMGVYTELLQNASNPALPSILLIHADPSFTLAFSSDSEAKEWYEAMKETSQMASDRDNLNKKMERMNRIAKELSNLIVYCCSINKFSMERVKTKGRIFYEMSSFPETAAEKLMLDNIKFFIWFHQVQLSRVYPKGQRLDSSNYSPVAIWNCGCQMVALNYQTGDKAMQLNQGRFRQNGGSGYILKPEFMFSPDFDPYSAKLDAIILSVTVIGARHLSKSGRGIVSPFVEIEILGGDFTGGTTTIKTKTIQDNGFNPVWNESFQFEVLVPELAMIRFVVQDEDMFGDPNFIGQASYSVNCLRQGYRSVPLQSGYSEDLELSSLLVHVTIKSEREEEATILRLRDALPALSKELNKNELEGDKVRAELVRSEFNRTQDLIICLVEKQMCRKSSGSSHGTSSRVKSCSSIGALAAAAGGGQPHQNQQQGQQQQRCNSVNSYPFQWSN